MTQIDRDLLRALRTDIDAALKVVGQKHGVVIGTGNASFTEASATFKLIVALTNPDAPAGESESPMVMKARSDYVARWHLFGMHQDWLGKTFGPYTVMGLLPKSTRYPVLAKKGGKLIKVTIATIQNLAGSV